MLRMYDWPGNVRELQNELQRYLAEQRLEFVGNAHLEPDRVPGGDGEIEGHGLYDLVAALERRLIMDALQSNLGHREKAAERLNIPPAPCTGR
jgi:two-component system response regulator HupR/HoxA